MIMQGLSLCIRDSGPLRNEIMASPDFWIVLGNLIANAQVAADVFEILEGITIGNPPTVTADNYEPAVKLLHHFASAGSVGATVEQGKDKKSRTGQQATDKKSSINATVARGVKAVTMIYSLTGRIPALMQQSLLESKEGECFSKPQTSSCVH